MNNSLSIGLSQLGDSVKAIQEEDFLTMSEKKSIEEIKNCGEVSKVDGSEKLC